MDSSQSVERIEQVLANNQEKINQAIGQIRKKVTSVEELNQIGSIIESMKKDNAELGDMFLELERIYPTSTIFKGLSDQHQEQLLTMLDIIQYVINIVDQ